MISAVVLVNTESNTQNAVLKSLRQVEEVEKAHALYGVYDILIKIKANSIDKVKEITKLRIKTIAGVKNSLTLMVIQDN